jgi:uncharacterized protein YjeT (DUF2065 family)
MSSLFSHILLAVALIFVIEGLIYAVFPRHIQKIMMIASQMNSDKFRYFGASMLAMGVFWVWLLQKLLTF